MITHCGESLIDMMYEPNGAYRPIVGGSPLNTAIASARLGSSVAILSSIATDTFGKMILRKLEANGVNTTALMYTDKPTTLAFAHLDDSGNADYSFYIEGTSITSITPKTLPQNTTCLQYGSISLLVQPSANAIRNIISTAEPHIVRSFDPNIRQMLIAKHAGVRAMLAEMAVEADIIKLGDEELQWIFPDKTETEATTFLLQSTPKLVCVTRGRKGASLYTKNNTYNNTGEQITVIDTVGAGDTLHGALLAWLENHKYMSPTAIAKLSDAECKELLSYAVRAASITCTRKGADPPTSAELD